MSAINSQFLANNLQNVNQNSSASLGQSKISNKVKLYLGPDAANIPGMTNFFSAPIEFFKSAKALLKADKIGDRQALFENGLRVVSAPFSFFNGASSIAARIIKAGIFLKIIHQSFSDSVNHLSTLICGAGFVMCAIELVLETFGLVRITQFYLKHFPSNKKLNQQEENVYLTRLTNLRCKYLQLSSKRMKKIEAHIQENLTHLSPAEQLEKKEKMIKANLEIKKNNLIRCVQPGLTKEIEQTIPEIIENLQSIDPLKREKAEEKAAEIYDQIKAQSHKKMLVHTIGLAAVLFTLVSLILSCVTCPFVIPLIMMIIGVVLSLVQKALNQGLLHSKGWKFEAENCLPSFLKETTKMAKPPEHFPVVLHFNPDRQKNLYRSPRRNIDFTIAIPEQLNFKNGRRGI